MNARGYRPNLGLVAAWACVLMAPACAERSAPLPGDMDPKKPWAAVSSTAAAAPVAPGIVDDKLFPLELVMQHQNELGIQPSQKEAILRDLDQAQSEFNRVEWELHGEKEKLSSLLAGERVDEQAAVDQAQNVTVLESKLKLAHLRLLIRVKNVLTPAQQAILGTRRMARP